jgi:Protein of unknown function (DUF2892)
MEKNVSGVDKVVRILAAVVVLVLYFTSVISGTLAIILLILAGILVLTSVIGFCPLYRLIGSSTRKEE